MVRCTYVLLAHFISITWSLPHFSSQTALHRTPGHNEPYLPNPLHPVPGKVPFEIDESIHYWEKHENNDQGGAYKRSSCPGVNVLANRGYIKRDGKNITYEEIAQASRDVFNFGDDNVMIVLGPSYGQHGNPKYMDLDMLADEAVQHVTNCLAAPTRNDIELGDNVNLNVTLLESLLNFSKDNETLTMEDMAEHHHLRHNQSKAENPKYRFGNIDAVCALAQYANLVGILGRVGPNGLNTVYVEDVRTLYMDENLPRSYQRRELPFFSVESNAYIDRMSHHIGFQIVRPYPEGDNDGRDVEPDKAKYEE